MSNPAWHDLAVSGAARLARKKKVLLATHRVQTHEIQDARGVPWVLIRTLDDGDDSSEMEADFAEQQQTAKQAEQEPRNGLDRSAEFLSAPPSSAPPNKAEENASSSRDRLTSSNKTDEVKPNKSDESDEESSEEDSSDSVHRSLCERDCDPQTYERNMMRRIRALLVNRGDVVEKAFVNPRKQELLDFLSDFFERNGGKTAGIFYIGHGSSAGCWDMHSDGHRPPLCPSLCMSHPDAEVEEVARPAAEVQKTMKYEIGWEDLERAGILKLRQALLYLDSCYSAVLAKNVVEGCRAAVTSSNAVPAIYSIAASFTSQKNFCGDLLLDVARSHRRCMIPEDLDGGDDLSEIVVMEQLRTASCDYSPCQFLFVPPGVRGEVLTM